MSLPKSRTMMPRPRTHVDRGRQAEITASSPRGIFSQAELTADSVISRARCSSWARFRPVAEDDSAFSGTISWPFSDQRIDIQVRVMVYGVTWE